VLLLMVLLITIRSKTVFNAADSAVAYGDCGVAPLLMPPPLAVTELPLMGFRNLYGWEAQPVKSGHA